MLPDAVSHSSFYHYWQGLFQVTFVTESDLECVVKMLIKRHPIIRACKITLIWTLETEYVILCYSAVRSGTILYRLEIAMCYESIVIKHKHAI